MRDFQHTPSHHPRPSHRAAENASERRHPEHSPKRLEFNPRRPHAPASEQIEPGSPRHHAQSPEQHPGGRPEQPPEVHRGRGPENHPDHRRAHHDHRHGERNFWSDWRDERHHHGRMEEAAIGQALSPAEMQAWREFFNQSFGTWPEAHWIFGGRRFSPWHQGIDTFNPFVATLLSKGGGLLPLYALHLISQKPRYGNELMDLLAEHTHGQWVSNPGAIYPLLTLLEKENFIQGQWEDPDKRTIRVYTITPAGQAEVARIKMIVLPKLTETVEVLQAFIAGLQSGAAPVAEETQTI